MGIVEDWKKVREKAKRLGDYDLAWKKIDEPHLFFIVNGWILAFFFQCL